MFKILDSIIMPPWEFCQKHGHKVKIWRETSGRGRYGICTRCREQVHEPEFS